MKFIIERDLLLKNLKYINSIVSSNNNLLNDINSISIIITNKNYIILKCNNNEIEININIKLLNNNFKNKYKINISYKKIYNICKNIDKKSKITFLIKKNYLLINNKNTMFYILIYKNIYKSIFKNNNNINNIISLSINKNSLINIINKTYFSTINSDIKNYINYMLFEIIKNKIFFTSTDGYRLSNYNFEIINNNYNISLLIPKKTINEINKFLLYINDDIINICICNKYIYIKTDYIIFKFLVYKNLFPNYINIINEKREFILDINKDKLLESIYKIISISDDKNPILRLIINKKNTILKLINSKNEVSIGLIKSYINYDFNNYEIGINPVYLINILERIDNKFIKIYFSNKYSSIKIEDIKDINNINIIMPIKI
ncbi:DNA polymerase III subunit beta [Candidatus Nardonella dryophthoridicola]|uniref:Beta sliding clamp n=1 Tax=endosymbiont of Rhynchophorus ferrugineus TaxID=1972133 RepID=A0A2Z5TPF7_9GAMM|nr:DNA polymerase III subunit beta [Candidatus Nardonella dryophthoridicola]BBA84964.1 DNA polymerase III subunit beta [endosymbiont of Rhynchophorus ferrugineus]